MEDKIRVIIENIIYNFQITELYNNKAIEYNFPMKIDIDKIPFNILYDFQEKYYEEFKDCILKNAFIYAKSICDETILKALDDYIDDNKIDEDIVFKVKMSDYAIKNIFNKHYGKVNDNKIIEDNIDIIKMLESTKVEKIKLQSLTIMYRNIFIDFLKNFNEEDVEIIIDDILCSDRYDNDLINKSNGILDIKNINTFKTILVRLILSDVFLYLNNYFNGNTDNYDFEFELEDISRTKLKDYSDRYNNQEDDDEFEDDFEDEDELEEEEEELDDNEIVKEINSNLLKYIRNCLETNKYIIPKDDEVRLNIFSIFYTYNAYECNRINDIKEIEKDKIKKLELNKINPLYLMDLMSTENKDN